MSRFWTCLLVGWLLTGVQSAVAQDRVTIRGGAAGRIIVTGTIVDYVGRKITISVGGSARSYPVSEVVQIETPQPAQQMRGLKLLDEGDFDGAQRELDAALKAEPRLWAKREILSQLVQCSLRRRDFVTAATRFKMLCDSDPTTRHFKLIPLIWTPERLPDASLQEARLWLEGSSDLLKLVGVSLLLDDPKSVKPVELILKDLLTNPDDRIRGMAKAQQWRKQIPTINELQLEQLRLFVERQPEDLRAGPSFLLGRAYLVRSDFELAATAFLWLPLVDDSDHYLAARACLDAADALASSGRKAESLNLLQELKQRFADTPFGGEAEDRLREVK